MQIFDVHVTVVVVVAKLPSKTNELQMNKLTPISRK